MIRISHNFKYMLANGYIYDVTKDESYNVKTLDENFWFDFYKENIKSSFINEIYDQEKIKSIIREFNFKLSSGINENQSFRQTLNLEKLLSVEFDKENITTIIENIFDDFKNIVILTEDNFISRGWNKLKTGVSKAFNWLATKGIDWFFEGLRKALYSWGGVAIQVFLSTVGAAAFGLGPLINTIVWALMLIYDVSKMLINSDYGFERLMNIAIDILGVVTTGPGGAVAKRLLTSAGSKIGALATRLGLKGGAGQLVAAFRYLQTSSIGSIIGKVISGLVTGFQTVFLKPLQLAGTWFAKNFKSNWVTQKVGSVGKFLSNISNGLKTTSNVSTKQVQAVVQGTSKTAGSSVGQTVRSLGNTQGGKFVKQAALGSGVAYGATAYSGGDTSVFGGAFKDDPENYLSDAEFTKQSDESYDELAGI